MFKKLRRAGALRRELRKRDLALMPEAAQSFSMILGVPAKRSLHAGVATPMFLEHGMKVDKLSDI